MKNNDQQKRVYISTYGCQMNEYDTELIRGILAEEGFTLTESEEEAEVVLLNTCAVRENAHRKVYGYLHSLRHQRNGNPPIVGLLGCMATNLKEELLKDSTLGLDFIAGPDSYRRLPELIRAAQGSRKQLADVELDEQENYDHLFPARDKGVNAWVAVMRGCNNFCTFCVVPYTRGRERSRSPEDILSEVRRAAGQGFPQVTLLGQNVNSYRHQETRFAELLKMVASVEGIRRVRFVAPHPKDFPLELLEVMAGHDNICQHIHLPLQAGNDRVLRLMNRNYTQGDFLALVKTIREVLLGVALTTDIIVGFPTETDEEFLDTVRVMEEVRFDSAFIFKYSPRKQTLASRKYPDDVPEEKKTERIVRLNELQKEISLQKNLIAVGQRQVVLIEEEETTRSAKDFQGRNDGNKVVVVPAGPYGIGDFVDVEITAATPHVLKARVIAA